MAKFYFTNKLSPLHAKTLHFIIKIMVKRYKSIIIIQAIEMQSTNTENMNLLSHDSKNKYEKKARKFLTSIGHALLENVILNHALFWSFSESLMYK